MKRAFCLMIVAVFLFSGCASMAKMSVEDMKTASEAFDVVMTQFIIDWPTISGAIDGAYEGRTFPVPSGHIKLKKEIDKIVGLKDIPNDVNRYKKGKIATLWASIVTAEVLRWIKEFQPSVFKLIPAALFVL